MMFRDDGRGLKPVQRLLGKDIQGPSCVDFCSPSWRLLLWILLVRQNEERWAELVRWETPRWRRRSWRLRSSPSLRFALCANGFPTCCGRP